MISGSSNGGGQKIANDLMDNGNTNKCGYINVDHLNLCLRFILNCGVVISINCGNCSVALLHNHLLHSDVV